MTNQDRTALAFLLRGLVDASRHEPPIINSEWLTTLKSYDFSTPAAQAFMTVMFEAIQQYAEFIRWVDDECDSEAQTTHHDSAQWAKRQIEHFKLLGKTAYRE